MSRLFLNLAVAWLAIVGAGCLVWGNVIAWTTAPWWQAVLFDMSLGVFIGMYAVMWLDDIGVIDVKR